MFCDYTPRYQLLTAPIVDKNDFFWKKGPRGAPIVDTKVSSFEKIRKVQKTGINLRSGKFHILIFWPSLSVWLGLFVGRSFLLLLLLVRRFRSCTSFLSCVFRTQFVSIHEYEIQEYPVLSSGSQNLAHDFIFSLEKFRNCLKSHWSPKLHGHFISWSSHRYRRGVMLPIANFTFCSKVNL